jgi:hypothetical protein
MFREAVNFGPVVDCPQAAWTTLIWSATKADERRCDIQS